MENNRALRLLVSVLGVSAMFGLGRVVANWWHSRDFGEPLLETPSSESIVIQAEPMEVYEHARQLEYFNQFLFGVDEFRLINPSSARLVVAEDGHEYRLDLEVIADQPGEFFGLRVEHDGELYGTAVVRFERMPGREVSTRVTVATKYKHEMPVEVANVVRPVVAREVATYLRNLKDSFVVAPV